MVKLPKYVSESNLIEEILGQFAFMSSMSILDPTNTGEVKFDLNDIFNKSIEFVKGIDDVMNVIDTEESNLPEKLKEFLKEWEEVEDVTAIQQNIHYNLKLKDTE